ncbi:MAG TPA: hypothetical protein PK340_06055 [Bacilli bacterium]|nr:hypothetical protein [Bacilli bacterium]
MKYVAFNESTQLGISMMFAFNKFELTTNVKLMTKFANHEGAQKFIDDLTTHLDRFRQILPIPADFDPKDYVVKAIDY